VVEEKVRRPWLDRLQRGALRALLPYPERFAPLLRFVQALRPLAPAGLRQKIPAAAEARLGWPPVRHARKMLVLDGCVQPALAPDINAAAARVLDRLGISLIRAGNAGCCGAVSYHLSAHEEGLDFMRRNIDTWLPHLDEGVEAIVITASGCGLMVKEYADALKNDDAYAAKAVRVSAAARDLVEVLEHEPLDALRAGCARKLAFQSPCTLQHGQKLQGRVERLLQRLGFELTPVADAHLCCGSAGTYSILQPDLSERLRQQKLAALSAGQPELIATANIGCLTHLQAATPLPVKHWIELLEVEPVAETP
jgi:glycolate oxidase iron-sulfur subunit